jgi:putative ABC transport system substrate-binding protein
VHVAKAQQQKKIPRIGYLASNIFNEDRRLDAFRQGLRQLGYAEGKDIVIESRSAGGLDRLNELATELVRLKVDVIVTSGAASTGATKAATTTISIAMTQDHACVPLLRE